MRKLSSVLFGLLLAACSQAPSAEEQGSSDNALMSSGVTFTSKGTGYYPAANAMEGGFVDRKGAKLRTLQAYLSGSADYVSVAMDTSAFPYGQHLRIKELEAKYGRPIDFRVVDTGGAFKGKGRSRIDICTASSKASLDPTINGKLTITTSTSAPSSTASTTAAQVSASEDSGDDASSTSAGAACASDGACNPGNDGSGQICVNGACVDGCRSDAQCPGTTTCDDGACN